VKLFIKNISNKKKARQVKRKLAIRKKISGTCERPRLCLIRTNKNVSVQIIDDSKEKTIFTFNSFGKNKVPDAAKDKKGLEVMAKHVAGKLTEKGLVQIVFDRNGKMFGTNSSAFVMELRRNGISV
jgi:large subunit ribosomal protein L18